METPSPNRLLQSPFVTTQWTQVLSARGNTGEARAALSELCAAYYSPVFNFISRNCRDPHAARDLTQEFFAQLLSKNSLEAANPLQGRFRSFLLGAVKHFLWNEYKHAHRQKRGGGQVPEPLGPDTDTSPGLDPSSPASGNPDREFDRKWALTILDRALVALGEEHKSEGKADIFETLKPWLTGDNEDMSLAEAAASLKMNEGAVKVAVHRLRRKFRAAIKSEIAQTLENPETVEQELIYLREALS